MIVNCPKCRGRGFIIHPNIQKNEPMCDMCLGKKTIDPDNMCICGRPAVQIVKDKPKCGNITCDGDSCPAPQVFDSWVEWTKEEEDAWTRFKQLDGFSS